MATSTPTARDALRGTRSIPSALLAVALATVLAACTGAASSPPAASAPAATPSGVPSLATGAPSPTAAPLSGSITVYTSVTQNTVDAIVEGFAAAAPGVEVEVFRAPTAEVAARIAAEQQSGGIGADILWLTDPLSIAGYADQGLLLAWTPSGAAELDPGYQAETYVGTRLLNVIIVKGASVTPGPQDWLDLTDELWRDAGAIPDAGFAGSAFGALGYFESAPGYGIDFYEALRDNGTTQVKTPDEVTTGVAEGRFKVGMTLDTSARTAIGKGSPIELVWPSSGAIAIYSPIGIVGASRNLDAAKAFEEYTLSADGQARIAETGWQPVLGPGGPEPGGSQVNPDWTALYGKQTELLDAYRAIFGG